MKLKILNKKGFDQKKIKNDQVFVKGEAKKAGDIVEMDPKNDTAAIHELVFNGWASPEDAEAKKVFPNWKSPFPQTEAAVSAADKK